MGLALVTWLPLLCLAVVQRAEPGPGQAGSFLASINNHVRFLVAIPLMFCAEVWIDPRLRHFVQDLVAGGLVTETETPALTRGLSRARAPPPRSPGGGARERTGSRQRGRLGFGDEAAGDEVLEEVPEARVDRYLGTEHQRDRHQEPDVVVDAGEERASLTGTGFGALHHRQAQQWQPRD